MPIILPVRQLPSVWEISKGNYLPFIFKFVLIPAIARERNVCLVWEKNYALTLEGGRLIQSLPMCFSEAIKPAFCFEQADHRCAFEADVMNLLTGLVAEVKFYAAQKGEVLNEKSLVTRALRLYGTSSIMNLIDDYLECFFSHPVERQHKFLELITASYNFINDSAIWGQVKALAAYLLAQSKTVIDCEEIDFF